MKCKNCGNEIKIGTDLDSLFGQPVHGNNNSAYWCPGGTDDNHTYAEYRDEDLADVSATLGKVILSAKSAKCSINQREIAWDGTTARDPEVARCLLDADGFCSTHGSWRCFPNLGGEVMKCKNCGNEIKIGTDLDSLFGQPVHGNNNSAYWCPGGTDDNHTYAEYRDEDLAGRQVTNTNG